MGSLDTIVGKYIRLAEDLHEMRAYLNDIRICFVALTVSCYVGIFVYVFLLCLRRRGGNASDDGGSGAGPRASRFRQAANAHPRRSTGRFDGGNYDAECGGGLGPIIDSTNEWDDMMPPPPNGSAIKTVDGYRYRNPSRTAKMPYPAHPNRLSVAMDSMEPAMGGKRQQLIVDNHTGTAAMMSPSQTPVSGGVTYTPVGRRSPSEHAFRDGFIEKSPSIA